MGGFFSGLASGLGGAGDAALNIGAQIRPILENRRQDLANVLMTAAQTETDPGTRSEMLQHIADLESGKPMGGITQGLFKTGQKRHADEQKLGQTAQQLGIGAGTAAPPPPPGAVPPGSTPGTGGNASPNAAQPAGNPIQGGGAIQPIGNSLDQALNAGTEPIQPIQAPQAAAPGASSPFDARAYREQLGHAYREAYNAAAPAARAAVTEEYKQNLAALAPLEDRQYKREQFDAFSQTSHFKNLPPAIQGEFAAQAYGYAPVPLGGMLMPKKMATAYGEQAPEGTLEYGTNHPVQHGVRYDVSVIPGTGDQMWIPAEAHLRTAEDAAGHRTVVAATPGADLGTAPGIVSANNRPRQMGVDANGHPVYESVQDAGQGIAPITAPGVEPSFIPRVTTSQRSISTVDANGNPVTELVPVTSTSRRATGGTGGASPTAPIHPSSPVTGESPSSPRTFPKPFTPEQQLKNVGSEGQYKLAIDRAQFVQNNLPMLNSLIDAKKLSLQIDPHTGFLMAAVNRAVPLTAKEAEFLGAFQNLREDINLLRGPLGATGFRGPEAFAALQAQAGTLLGRPEVTKSVLDGTLKAMKVQMNALHNANSGKGVIQPAGPKVGEVENGFRFKGGDPGQQSNWERIH